jgi:hypothetical protein
MAAEKDNRLRILLSYWYFKSVDLDRLIPRTFTEPYPEIFADSGAFSAMTQGAKVDLEEYARWLLRYKHWFGVYANLDVIRHAELTWSNQQILEDRYGLEPLPVFHVAEGWDWLHHYLERYRYIALGVAGHPTSRYMGWVVRCFKERGDPPRAAYHGFGITSWKALRSFPWYSVDSSSWAQGYRYGQVPLFDERKGTFTKLALGDRAAWLRHAPLVRRYGYDPRDFGERARNERRKVAGLCAVSYISAERWLRRYWGPQAIPAREGAQGIRIFLADGAGGMNRPGEAQAALHEHGPHLYLADTSPLPKGLGHAQEGLKLYVVDSNTQHLGWGEQGLKTYLAEPRPTLSDSAAAQGALLRG